MCIAIISLCSASHNGVAKVIKYLYWYHKYCTGVKSNIILK